MDEIVAAIVNRLLLREQQSLTIDAAKFDAKKRSQSDFINHQRIYVESIGAVQLAKLAKLDSQDAFTCWLLRGLELNCEIHLTLGFSIVTLIPRELFDWPLSIKTRNNQELKTFHQKIISYQEVALLTSTDMLVRFPHQQLTALAKDFIRENKIPEIVRY